MSETRSTSDLERQLGSLVAAFNARPNDEPVAKWILPDASREFLNAVAQLLPPDSAAFEFGSGRSTHTLRGALAAVASVEDSADWLSQTETIEGGVAARAADMTTVIPLTRCWNRFRPIESFDVESNAAALDRLRTAQLVLVDSPPNPAKREHALFCALRFSPVGAVIVIDDLDVRATARFTHRLAHQNSRAFRFWRLNIDHILGVFLKLESRRIRSLPTAREFVGTWMRA